MREKRMDRILEYAGKLMLSLGSMSLVCVLHTTAVPTHNCCQSSPLNTLYHCTKKGGLQNSEQGKKSIYIYT